MNPRLTRFIPALLAIALFGVSWEGYRVHGRQQQAESHRTLLGGLRQDELTLQHAQAASVRELALARQELAALEAGARGPDAGPDAAMRTWWGVILRIREEFDRHPDQSIPELQLLEPKHWIKLAAEARFDEEESIRKTLGAVRTLAKQQIMTKGGLALFLYGQTHDGQLPTTMEQLAESYPGREGTTFPVFANPEITRRYRIVASGKGSDLPREADVFAEIAPIDPKWDKRLTVGLNHASLLGWNTSEMDDAYGQAAIAYMKANGGREADKKSDVVPYIQSPVMRAVIQAREEYALSHGRETWDTAELRPYLPSPESQVLAEKLWPKER